MKTLLTFLLMSAAFPAFAGDAAAGGKPDVVWRADFGERIAATPAIVDDTLYVRTETKLFAFKGAK